MLVLAAESSTAQGSVAIVRDDQILAFESSMQQRAHSEFINPAIERCLIKAQIDLSEIDVFATGLGPGSFTGIRVAGNTIKALGYSFQKPLVAIDSLELLARPALSEFKNILCIINAYKNMVYYSVYLNGSQIGSPSVVKVDEIESVPQAFASPCLCLGDGYNAYEKTFSQSFKARLFRESSLSDYPSAATLALAAVSQAKLNKTIEWNSFVPLYIRASEAEENLKN